MFAYFLLQNKMENASVTLFVSEMSITMYSCKKKCESCEKTFDKYCKFLVLTCCGYPKRFCLGCDPASWTVPCQKCREEGSEQNNISVIKEGRKQCMLIITLIFYPKICVVIYKNKTFDFFHSLVIMKPFIQQREYSEWQACALCHHPMKKCIFYQCECGYITYKLSEDCLHPRKTLY